MYSKGNYKQGEKTTLRMEENNSKWNNWQRINFKNIQAPHTAQYQKNKQPNQKVGKYLNKEDTQMANKHMKRCSILLISIEFPIKPQWGITSHWSEWPPSKKSKNNKCWRGCGDKGTLLHFWWECKLIQPLWKTVWRFP